MSTHTRRRGHRTRCRRRSGSWCSATPASWTTPRYVCGEPPRCAGLVLPVGLRQDESRGVRTAPHAVSPSPRAALASSGFRVTLPPVWLPQPRGCAPVPRSLPVGLPLVQVEEDNREILRLLRDTGTAEKLEGMKRLIAQSACAPAAVALWRTAPRALPLATHTPHPPPHRSVRRP